MRKSVAIGFGLWLLAVASVAVIAWLAINTAGHQVTAVRVIGPGPTSSVSNSSSPVVEPSVRVVPAARTSPDATPASTSRATPDNDVVRTYFGTFSTAGGRVRAKCAERDVSLEGGGYARPETGWEVKMLPSQPRQLAVFFGSTRQAIEVLAVCSGGRPAFTQQSQTLHEGNPYVPGQQGGRPTPAPSGNVLRGPAPEDAVIPSQPAAPLAAPLAAPAPAISVTSQPAAPAAADPAQVAAYVQAQNQWCAQDNWSSDWCHRWVVLSDAEREQLVQRWLASDQDGGRGDGYGDGRDGWTGRDGTRASRTGQRYPSASPAATGWPAASSDVPAPVGSGISPTSGS